MAAAPGLVQVSLEIWQSGEIMSPALQISHRFGAGKRPNRSTVNNLSAGVNSALLHVYDANSNKYFLVDTGSALSVLPPGIAKATRPNNQPLIAANGTPIKSFGTRQIELQLGLQKYTWRFIVAEVTQPIMGADFLRSHSLLVLSLIHI